MRRRIALAFAAAGVVAAALAPTAGAAPLTVGAVYTETNSPAGNSVLVWGRHDDGSLTFVGSFDAGGVGTGASLGDQGAVSLSDNGKWLYAVNAGSNQITAFEVFRTALFRADIVGSGGTRPVSITSHGNLVYVLNAGGSGNITGFRRGPDGLEPIPGSTQALSAAGAGAAQISFDSNGRTLVVTEKATSRIDVFPVDHGVAGPATVVTSSGATPYGFAITKRDTLIVSEAGPGAASSYRLENDTATLVTASLVDHGAAPCWFVATDDGRFAYTTNAASATISGYAVDKDGSISLLDPSGVSATTAGGPTDEALDPHSRLLYVRLGNGGIQSYGVNADGSLTPLTTTWGLPAGVVGLAVS
jgi:6-phosphogluconolactonase (cycloisomerase 2 family)